MTKNRNSYCASSILLGTDHVENTQLRCHYLENMLNQVHRAAFVS